MRLDDFHRPLTRVVKNGAFWMAVGLGLLIFCGRTLYYRSRGDYNLLDHLSEARVHLKRGENEIPFIRWVRQQWFPAAHRPRWNRVGRTTATLAGMTREVIWAHPVTHADLIIEYPHVPWSDELVLQYGLTDWAVRWKRGAEVVIRVEVEGGPRLTLVQPNRPGWNETVISTDSLRGRSGRLRLIITTEKDTRRHFCFNGFTRKRRATWVRESLANLRRPGSAVERLGAAGTVVAVFLLLLIPAYLFFSRHRRLGMTGRARWPLIALWATAFLLSALIAGHRLFTHSIAPHHIYQAEAFLHGRLSLPVEPPNRIEWVERQGKTYVAMLPTPALLVAPAVAVAGLATSDVLFGVVLAACNVVLFYILLQALAMRRLCLLSIGERYWLVALFAVGTIHLACSKVGGAWFNSHLVAVMVSFLFVLSIVARWRPVWSGLFLILGALARLPILFYFPLLAIGLLESREDGHPLVDDPTKLKRWLKQVALPMASLGGLMMLMNLVRFGDPFWFPPEPSHAAEVREYGWFHLHYLARNCRLAFLQPPEFVAAFPFVRFQLQGMSIFFTTPAWLGVFWLRRDMPYKRLWVLATALVVISTLAYVGTGGGQFGYRYSLDYTPLLLLLLAQGRTRLGGVMKTLIALSILINLAGAIWFAPW
ncbi:MAG: hypothetical protein D6723_04155 [Acidobacteria bacterium]|nr:MAG: hypothetical protein D6723_04155 [Acidobacteriota bacterium]